MAHTILEIAEKHTRCLKEEAWKIHKRFERKEITKDEAMDLLMEAWSQCTAEVLKEMRKV